MQKGDNRRLDCRIDWVSSCGACLEIPRRTDIAVRLISRVGLPLGSFLCGDPELSNRNIRDFIG
jgi:hypothetical protein